jgi:hypothetical protein
VLATNILNILSGNVHLTIEHHNNIPESLLSPQLKKYHDISKNSFLPIKSTAPQKISKRNKIIVSKIPSCTPEE